ncbi:MAG: cytochrome c3 family protein [Phycisphaerales bacterium]
MKHKGLSISIALVSLLAVGAVAWWGFNQRTSPGPLHPTHAALKDLRGNRGCDACHGKGTEGEAMKTGMARSCLECHAPIRGQIDGSSGIHGALAEGLRRACEKCHREHLGQTIALVSDNSFQLAGVPLADKYDHGRTAGGWHLEGKHLRLECQNCHKSAYETMLGKGEFRYLGLQQTCVPCHEDVHKGELGGDCASCHGQERPFKESPLFKHPERFPLVGGHRAPKCGDCHTEKGVFTGLKSDCVACHQKDFDKTAKPAHAGTGLGTACADCHGVEKWGQDVKFTHPGPFRLEGAHAKERCEACHTAREYTKLVSECASCHKDEYDKTTEPNHATAGMKTSCADCHGVAGWKEGVRFDHPASFPLGGVHAATTCTQCHAPGVPERGVAAFKEEPSCGSCHASPHAEGVVRAAAARAKGARPDACAACHVMADASWWSAGPRMSAELHGATGFPLTAPHVNIECRACHAGYAADRAAVHTQEEYRASYPGRGAQQCEACHTDPHDGQFLASGTRGRCVACHEASRFSPVQFGAKEHAQCRFPLDGSHTAVACSACHKVEQKGDVKFRRFVLTATVCADCHKDVHDGAFDRAGSAKVVRGKAGCARCHTTKDFREVAWGPEDHKLWTGSELLGRHAGAACADCHRRPGAGAAPGAARPARVPAFTKAPEACVECHADVHAGQFAVKGVDDCTRCHRSTESFRTLTFQHDRDSGFALDADHAKLACDACHKAYEVQGVSIVRYKPLGTKCSDCHGIVPAQAKQPTGGQGK